MVVTVVILGTIVGCKKKDPDCASVIDGLIGRLQSSPKASLIPDEVRSNLKAVLSNRCTEDKWSAQARTCVNAATTEEEITKCGYKHLSQEQGDKLSRATTSVVGNSSVHAAEAPEASEASVAMAKMSEFADRMCQCTAKPCADRVQEDMTRWSTEMAAKASRNDSPPDEATLKKMTEIGQRYGECMTTAMTTHTRGKASQVDIAMATMSEFADQMCGCTGKSCADRVQDRMTKWSTDMAAQGGEMKDEKPNAATMRKMTEVGQKYAECMTVAMTANRPSSAKSVKPPQECADYKVAIMKLADCDKLPRTTRDALRESYEQTALAWSNVPEEGRAALATACKSAAEAVTQSAAACN